MAGVVFIAKSRLTVFHIRSNTGSQKLRLGDHGCGSFLGPGAGRVISTASESLGNALLSYDTGPLVGAGPDPARAPCCTTDSKLTRGSALRGHAPGAPLPVNVKSLAPRPERSQGVGLSPQLRCVRAQSPSALVAYWAGDRSMTPPWRRENAIGGTARRAKPAIPGAMHRCGRWPAWHFRSPARAERLREPPACPSRTAVSVYSSLYLISLSHLSICYMQRPPTAFAFLSLRWQSRSGCGHAAETLFCRTVHPAAFTPAATAVGARARPAGGASGRGAPWVAQMPWSG